MSRVIQELEQAMHRLDTGKIEQGLECINQIVKRKDLSAQLRVEIAEALYARGFLSQAINIVEALSEQEPGNTELLLLLAELYMENDQEEEALFLLQEIPEDDANHLAGVLLSAEINLRQGLPEAAEYKVREALKIYPDEKILYQALAEVYFEQEEYTLAIINFQKGEEAPAEKLAHCYAHSGQFEEALTYYEQALKENKHVDLLFGAGFVAFQLQEWDRAIGYLEELVQTDPYYTSSYKYLTEAYLFIDRMEQAWNTIVKGLRYDEMNADLHYLYGEILLKRGEEEEALAAFEQALNLESDHFKAMESLIQLYQKEGELKKSLHCVEQLLESSPYRGDLWLKKAELHEELEEWQEALATYQQAHELAPDDITLLNKWALLLRDEGRIEEAKELWRKSFQLEPDQWEIIDLLKED